MEHPDLRPRQEASILLALWLVMFAVSSQFLLVAPILPRIHEALGVPKQLLGTLVTGYAVAVAVFAILAGPVSDRVGRRAILRTGSALMGLALLLHGFARSYESLLFLRVLAGMSSGVLSGAAVAYVGDVLPYHRRGRALGLVMSALAFGQIVGIPMGTLIAGRWGFQAPFIALGVVSMIAFVGTLHALVPTPGPRATELSLAAGIRKYHTILARRDLQAVLIASAVLMLSVSTYIVYMPTWLEHTFSAGPEQIASLFLVGGFANASIGPLAGRLSDRIGRKGLVIGSCAGLSVTMAATPFIPSFGWAYAVFFLNMCLVGARVSPLNAWMTALVSGRDRGSLLSLSMATGQIGMAFGAAAAGWTYTHSGYATNALMASAGAIVTALVLGLGVAEVKGDPTEG